MRRDGLGQLVDQRAELPDLGAERIGRRLRLVDRDADVLLHLGETPIHLGDLTRDIGAAARQVGQLVTDRSAQSDAGRDRIVQGERC